MLNFDQHIFEEVSRYEEGELEESERDVVARKIKNDEAYRIHLDYYHTVVNAIGHASRVREVERMRETALSAEDTDTLNTLLSSKNRPVIWMRFGTLATLLLAVVAIPVSFWLGTNYVKEDASPDNAAPPVETLPLPEEGEIPIATSGTAEIWEIEQETTTRLKRQIAVSFLSVPEIEYSVQDDKLKLFVPVEMKDTFEKNKPGWRSEEIEGENMHFLQYKSRYFHLYPGSGRLPLTPVTETKLLQILK